MQRSLECGAAPARGLFWLALAGLAVGLACSRADDARPATQPGRDAAFPAAETLGATNAFALASPELDYAHPDLAVAADDALCLTWLAFDGHRDEVLAALYVRGRWGDAFRVSEAPGIYSPPRIAADPAGGFFVVWAARAGDGYAVLGRAIRDGALEPLQQLSDGRRIDTEPVIAAAGHDLWLAWESFEDGRFDIRARRRSGATWGEVVRVTDHPRSDVQPALGVDASGTPWVAWVSWRDGDAVSGNYEVYASQLPAGGAAEAAAPLRVSRSPHVDMFPGFARVGPDLALVWTEAYFPARDIEDVHTVAYQRWTDKRYQVAWWEGESWGAPREVRVAPGEEDGPVPGDRATPVAPPAADTTPPRALWLLHDLLVSRATMDRTWATTLVRVDPGGASAGVDLSQGATGPGGRLGSAWLEGELWVAETVERDAGPAPSERPSWLRLQRLAPAALPAPEPAELAESAPRTPPDAALVREQPGRRSGGRIEHDAHIWQAYFGNLHSHSDFSRDRRGFNGSPVQAFRSVYDVAELDFAGLSDHVEWLRPREWWEIRKVTDLWNRPGEFVTFASYEWTSFEYGHRNVFFPEAAIDQEGSRFSSTDKTPDDLWHFLEDRRAITIPHHPAHGIRKPVDWSYRNDEFQRLAEIFQSRGSYEYDGAPYQRRDLRPAFHEGHSIRHALELGHRTGIIASPDHGGGMGLAGVWAEALSRESLFEALHARRTWGTTGAKMELFLTVGGAPQGSEILSDGAPLALTATVRATAPGLDLVLVVDGREEQSWHV
ncbi:MAG TPA: DUF3604 domain-containing protein, partial [Myxococcota bacterium]